MNYLHKTALAAFFSLSFVLSYAGRYDLPGTFGPDGPRPTTDHVGGPPVHVATGGHGFWEVMPPGEGQCE